jgi:hypothetical protein
VGGVVLVLVLMLVLAVVVVVVVVVENDRRGAANARVSDATGT